MPTFTKYLAKQQQQQQHQERRGEGRTVDCGVTDTSSRLAKTNFRSRCKPSSEIAKGSGSSSRGLSKGSPQTETERDTERERGRERQLNGGKCIKMVNWIWNSK